VAAALFLIVVRKKSDTQRVIQQGNQVGGTMSSSTISMNGESFKITNGRVFVIDCENGTTVSILKKNIL
jgi:hypothetical protein